MTRLHRTFRTSRSGTSYLRDKRLSYRRERIADTHVRQMEIFENRNKRKQRAELSTKNDDGRKIPRRPEEFSGVVRNSKTDRLLVLFTFIFYRDGKSTRTMQSCGRLRSNFEASSFPARVSRPLLCCFGRFAKLNGTMTTTISRQVATIKREMPGQKEIQTNGLIADVVPARTSN